MPPGTVISIATLSIVFVSVKGVKPCSKVNPPGDWYLSDNCSVSCSLHLLASTEGENEIPLCNTDSSALSCSSHEDCRKNYAGAACKKIPCACEEKSGSHYYFVLDHRFRNKIPSLKACTVSLKWLNPDEPIVPFPWKTLLVVFAIVASFAVCLLLVRWLTPCIRAMQSKSFGTRRQSEVEGQPFTAVPLQETPPPSRLPHRTPRIASDSNQVSHSSQRRNIYNQFFRPLRNGSSADKPPPYEVAIQEPPSYSEEFEQQQPLNCHTENSILPTGNLNRELQHIQQNVISNTSINTI